MQPTLPHPPREWMRQPFASSQALYRLRFGFTHEETEAQRGKVLVRGSRAEAAAQLHEARSPLPVPVLGVLSGLPPALAENLALPAGLRHTSPSWSRLPDAHREVWLRVSVTKVPWVMSAGNLLHSLVPRPRMEGPSSQAGLTRNRFPGVCAGGFLGRVLGTTPVGVRGRGGAVRRSQQRPQDPIGVPELGPSCQAAPARGRCTLH